MSPAMFLEGCSVPCSRGVQRTGCLPPPPWAFHGRPSCNTDIMPALLPCPAGRSSSTRREVACPLRSHQALLAALQLGGGGWPASVLLTSLARRWSTTGDAGRRWVVACLRPTLPQPNSQQYSEVDGGGGLPSACAPSAPSTAWAQQRLKVPGA